MWFKHLYESISAFTKKRYLRGFASKRNTSYHSKARNETLDSDISLIELRKMFIDPHVAACIQSRKSGVFAKEWQIVSTGEYNVQGQFITKLLEEIDLKSFISDILDAPLFGYGVTEILWSNTRGQIIPVGLISRAPWWFAFGKNGELLFQSDSSSEYKSVPRDKFLVIKNNANAYNPYGESVLRRCYKSYVRKNDTIDRWDRFNKKYGMPTIVGKLPAHARDIDIEEFGDNLYDLAAGGTMVTLDGQEVDLLQGQISANSQVFLEYIHLCNAEISKAILSQTLTTEQGNTGSYAMSQTHLQVRNDVVESDVYLVETVMNELIKKIIELNFANVKNMPKFKMYEKTDVDKVLAERDKILVDSGIQFTEAYFKEAYGFKDEHFKVADKPATAPAMFAEPTKENNNSDLKGLITNFGVKSLNTLSNKLIEDIQSAFIDTNSFEEALEKINTLYPEFSTKEIEELIEKSLNSAGVLPYANS